MCDRAGYRRAVFLEGQNQLILHQHYLEFAYWVHAMWILLFMLLDFLWLESAFFHLGDPELCHSCVCDEMFIFMDSAKIIAYPESCPQETS